MKQKEQNRIIYSKSIDVYSKFVSQSHVSCLYAGTCSFHPKWVFQNMFESDKMIISILSRSKVHQNFQNLQCSNTSFDSPDADWGKIWCRLIYFKDKSTNTKDEFYCLKTTSVLKNRFTDKYISLYHDNFLKGARIRLDSFTLKAWW